MPPAIESGHWNINYVAKTASTQNILFYSLECVKVRRSCDVRWDVCNGVECIEFHLKVRI